jgi:hypothetical protein
LVPHWNLSPYSCSFVDFCVFWNGSRPSKKLGIRLVWVVPVCYGGTQQDLAATPYPLIEGEVVFQPTVCRQVCPGIRHPPGAHNQILITAWLWGFLLERRPARREDGFLISSYNCYWALPALSPLAPSPAKLVSIFYCLVWEWVPISRLLRIAGLR